MKRRSACLAFVVALALSSPAARGGPPDEAPSIGTLVEQALGTDPDAVMKALDGLSTADVRWSDDAGTALSTIVAVIARDHWAKDARGVEVRVHAFEASSRGFDPLLAHELVSAEAKRFSEVPGVDERVAKAAQKAAQDAEGRMQRRHPGLKERLGADLQKTRSEDNIRSLLLMCISERAAGKPWQAFSGKRFVLWLVAKNFVDRSDPRNLEILFSPGDATRSLEKAGGPAAYAAVTLEALRTEGGDYRKLTSYVGRRNREKAHLITAADEAMGTLVIADLSFPDGIVAGYTNGAARWISREELGVPPGVPITVGDDSPNEELKHLSDE